MGTLVQLDASAFAWLEDRGPALTLHGAIDDATGTGLALYFRATEDLHGYATLLAHLCTRYGLPLTLYGDRLGCSPQTPTGLAEELLAPNTPPPWGAPADPVGYIAARSPRLRGASSASGKRADRLVSELRLTRRGTSGRECLPAPPFPPPPPRFAGPHDLGGLAARPREPPRC